MVKKRFTVIDFLEQPHYIDILHLIIWARNNRKKIKFKHLQYVFVKNFGYKKGKIISDKKDRKMKKFFDFIKDPELLKIFDIKKISTGNNLNTTYLANLKREKLIFVSNGCYVPTSKAKIYVYEYLCHSYIDLFFEESNKAYGKNTIDIVKASFVLEEEILNLIDRLLYHISKKEKLQIIKPLKKN